MFGKLGPAVHPAQPLGGVVPRPPRTSRDELVDHAARLVRERGVIGLRVRDVAQAAGVAAGTVYNYFPGRDDLLLAVAARAEATVIAVMARAAPAEVPLPGAVPELVDAVLSLADADRATPGLWQLPPGTATEGAGVRAWLIDRIRVAQQRGEVGAGEPHVVADLSYVLVRTALQHLTNDHGLRRQLAATLPDALLALLVGTRPGETAPAEPARDPDVRDGTSR
jgi:AcrR family transcriptional regulator